MWLEITEASERWGDVWQVAGVGFGAVFVVLILLSVAIWVTGFISTKMDASNTDEQSETPKAS